MSPVLRALPIWLRRALVVAAASAPESALGSTQCPLRTIPETPPAGWASASDAARARLATASGDCSEVVLEIEGGIGTLTFATSDGRHAARVLHDPAELAPALDALLVTLPEHAAAPPAEHREPAHGERVAAKEAPAVPAPSAVRMSALLGGRVSGPGAFVAPAVDLGVGIGSPRWELGVVAEWCPLSARLDGDDSRPARLASIGAGVAVGRRMPIGGDTALVSGVSLRAAAQHEGFRTPDPTTGKMIRADDDRAQALVGAYAALVYPASGRTRFRSSLAADVDATHLGDDGPPATGVPPLPWWGVTVSFGVESEVL